MLIEELQTQAQQVVSTQSSELVVRAVEKMQANLLHALVVKNRPELRKWFPLVWPSLDLVLFKEYIQLLQDENWQGDSFTFSLWIDNKIIGVVGLRDYNKQNRSASIWYWVDSDSSGKGYCTLACKGLIQSAFKVLNFHRIDLWCAVNNLKSNAVAMKLGFTYEGTLREAEWVGDHYEDLRFYGLLKKEHLCQR